MNARNQLPRIDTSTPRARYETAYRLARYFRYNDQQEDVYTLLDMIFGAELWSVVTMHLEDAEVGDDYSPDLLDFEEMGFHAQFKKAKKAKGYGEPEPDYRKWTTRDYGTTFTLRHNVVMPPPPSDWYEPPIEAKQAVEDAVKERVDKMWSTTWSASEISDLADLMRKFGSPEMKRLFNANDAPSDDTTTAR